MVDAVYLITFGVLVLAAEFRIGSLIKARIAQPQPSAATQCQPCTEDIL